MVLGPEDGESFWQPGPHHGYMTVKLSPRNHPSNQFSMGIQVMPPGCHVRSHGHARNDEVLFIYAGSGRCVIDGETHAIEPGSTVVLGRYVEHSIHNDGPDDMKFFWVFTPPGLEHVAGERFPLIRHKSPWNRAARIFAARRAARSVGRKKCEVRGNCRRCLAVAQSSRVASD